MFDILFFFIFFSNKNKNLFLFCFYDQKVITIKSEVKLNILSKSNFQYKLFDKKFLSILI